MIRSLLSFWPLWVIVGILVLLFSCMAVTISERNAWIESQGITITDHCCKRDPVAWGRDKDGKFVLIRDKHIIYKEK